jgi:hypothetical protein
MKSKHPALLPAVVMYENSCVLLWQAQLEKEALEDARYREQLEQERRDHELALRLAQETNDQLEEMSPQENRKYVQTLLCNVGFEVLIDVVMRSSVLWCITTPCSLLKVN